MNKFPGLGVIIRQLFGNQETVETYNSALGKTIKLAKIEDNELRLLFTDGTGIVFSDQGQSCCEQRYMMTDDKLEDFTEAKFTGVEIVPGDSIPNEYGEHEVEFLNINTSLGRFQMASHNEHNGYYGGFSIEIKPLNSDTKDAESS